MGRKFESPLVSESPLACEWAVDLNPRSAAEVYATDKSLVWWRCTDGHVWQATPLGRTRSGGSCRTCVRSMVSYDRSLGHLHPDLATEWSFKNSRVPTTVGPDSSTKY